MTEGTDYTDRLSRLSEQRWKRLLNVQAPYRWNLRRLQLGFVLDVGCGLGRNLLHLDCHGVGVDHNASSVAAACRTGLTAFTPEQFQASEYAQPGRFDSLLVAHVVEHLPPETTADLYRHYLPYVKQKGKVVVITPQERGYASDDTHVRYVDATLSGRELTQAGVTLERSYSFPLPRLAGRVFRYNEFVVLGRRH